MLLTILWWWKNVGLSCSWKIFKLITNRIKKIPKTPEQFLKNPGIKIWGKSLPKFGKISEIWPELWNLIEILKFGQKGGVKSTTPDDKIRLQDDSRFGIGCRTRVVLCFRCVSDCFRSFQIVSDYFYLKFQIFYQVTDFLPNFRISTKFQNFNQIRDLHQILEFQPNFGISTKFRNFHQISEYPTHFEISTKFQNFHQITKFGPNFGNHTKFWNFYQISESWPNFGLYVKSKGN